MSSNQADMRSGICKYCGQVRMVSAEKQEDADTIASKECDCPDAIMQRNRDRQYKKASQNIVKIFQDNQEITEILDRAARMIADEKIAGVTVKCGKITAKAAVTSKGTIKISCTEKNESSLES